jgi:hypothetical protein
MWCYFGLRVSGWPLHRYGVGGARKSGRGKTKGKGHELAMHQAVRRNELAIFVSFGMTVQSAARFVQGKD